MTETGYEGRRIAWARCECCEAFVQVWAWDGAERIDAICPACDAWVIAKICAPPSCCWCEERAVTEDDGAPICNWHSEHPTGKRERLEMEAAS